MLLRIKKGDRFITPVPGHRSKIGSEMVLNGGDYVAFLMVQPEGIPLSPLGQEDIFAFLTNVPFEPTPETQFIVPSLPRLVAIHLI